MLSKIVLCLILLAVVPFSMQNKLSEEVKAKLKGVLKKRQAECGKKNDGDVKKLSLKLLHAKSSGTT